MPTEKFMKMTYDDGMKKHNVYLRMPSPTFAVLKREIALSLFEERGLPQCDVKIYWIDEDRDDIEIFNQSDYEIFLSKRSERQHLHVEPLKTEPEIKKSATTLNDSMPDNDPAAFVIHDRVECDGCNLAPIVGFRYKCIQCPNYDLCQRCEAQHKHHEHMMVRMPTADAPTVVDAWVTAGRCGRRSSKRFGRGCPFVAQPAATAQNGNATATDEGTDHHRRKHHRRVRNGIFSNLYDMMQDLAEGGAAHRTEENSEAATAAAQNVANEAANIAQEVAAKATQSAAQAAQSAAQATAQAFVAAKMPTPAPSAPEEPAAAEPKVETAAPKAAAPDTTTTPNNADKPKANADPTIPTVPSLENLAQFIDPQYMRAGIQILNNFSEMFAKMIDPMDDGSSLGCPFQATTPTAMPPTSERKNSAASMASTSSGASTSAAAAATATAASTAAATTSNAGVSTTAKPTVVESFLNDLNAAGSSVTGAVPKAASEQREQNVAIDNAPGTSGPSPTGRNSRALSEDNDWQVIDQQAVIDVSSSNESFGIELPASRASLTDAAAATTAANSVEASMQMNFEQLSKDLRAHVEHEQRREAQVVAAAGVTFAPSSLARESVTSLTDGVASTTANNAAQTDDQTATATQTVVTPTASPAPSSISIGTSTNATSIRRYHENDVINEAVIAMMAMGFSNEGAWLTQLLESVNGNISSALDIMSSAQRNRN